MNSVTYRVSRIVASFFLVLSSCISGSAADADVEQWGAWEKAFDGPREENPYRDVKLSFTFRQGNRSVDVAGFYTGNGVYRVRYSPPVQGEWRYETSSDHSLLDSKAGSFHVGPPAVDNHGPVQVSKTFYFRYADGTPYHQFGTTCYAWTHQTEELQQQTLQTLAASPFNKIRFCVFPKSYTYNQNDPERFAFQRTDDGKFDFDRPDPAFWHHFEQRSTQRGRGSFRAALVDAPETTPFPFCQSSMTAPIVYPASRR